MLLAELAIFGFFQAVRRIFLVFHCIVVSLLAFGACQNDLFAHNPLPPSSSIAKKLQPKKRPNGHYI
jgi:hypothetical protein